MTTEIKREHWKEFFDQLSRERLDWETSIQVLSDESGAQFLSEGLPFTGLTLEDSGQNARIDLTVGTGTESHQTHAIANPKMVAFEGTGTRSEGTLDIEDEGGTKTLIKFTQPKPTIVDYSETDDNARHSQST